MLREDGAAGSSRQPGVARQTRRYAKRGEALHAPRNARTGNRWPSSIVDYEVLNL
jgi:hypothetical protein